MTGLMRTPIDHHVLVDAVRSPRCGAVILLLGTVRELTGEQVTEFLDYEAYGPMAERKLAEIEADVRRRWVVGDVAIVHRLGRLEVGEVSVVLAVSSLHRREAFEAGQYAIDALKSLVPIWKKENAPGGVEGWVHQSAGRGLAVRTDTESSAFKFGGVGVAGRTGSP
ncbi:molybdenum cofactor biosynthesis protein MoaE [bacterium]|nr:molybdenum cofactor biosynthesis protein MoaE [bacterium]